jgi:uncharacterized protein YndB with AHSA1/START domain
MSTRNDADMIQVQTVVNAPIEKVWSLWTEADHIKNWCSASDDWHVPGAENDLRVGGKFKTVMAARDGSMQFDFGGEYTAVTDHEFVEYFMADGRKVDIKFTPKDNGVEIIERFDAENTHPREMQQQGWQSILENFKKYVESN